MPIIIFRRRTFAMAVVFGIMNSPTSEANFDFDNLSTFEHTVLP